MNTKKEEYVYKMFNSIAYRYDILNTILSFHQDKYWRKFTTRKTGLEKGGTALDVCCGTGMLTIELAKAVGRDGRVTGLDFSENMLDKARENINRKKMDQNVELVYGKATELPFQDNYFDCATIAFALRNVPSIEDTIKEMRRVVKPGGRLVSLELSKPGAPFFKQLYYFYFYRLVPFLGKLGIGQEGPYRYLPASVKAFPHQKEIRDLFESLSLKDASYFELTGGIVTVHVGTKQD